MDGGLLMDFSRGSRFPTASSAEEDPGFPLGMLQQFWAQNQGEAAKMPENGGLRSSGAENFAFSMAGTGLSSSQDGSLPEAACFEQAVCLEPAPMQLDSCEVDPLKDPVFNYLSDMMDEEVDERTCMFIDCSGYQAMAQELTQIISDSSSSGASPSGETDLDKSMDTWIDGLFIPDAVSPESSVSAAPAESFESSEVTQPVSDEVVEKQMIHFLTNMQDAIEKSAAPSKSSKKSKVQEPRAVSTSGGNQEQQRDFSSKDFMCLQSLLVECSDYLKPSTTANDPDPEHPPFHGDLLTPPNQVEAGLIRDAVEDTNAIEKEKVIRQELHAKLIECAQAVGADDMAKAYNIVNSFRDKVSAHGNGTERMAFYFAEALVARITGTGALLYTALASSKPPFNEMLKAHRLFAQYAPNVRISHYFCNQTILDASEGASRVHIVDYGILYGLPWPCLIKAFAERKGGPPHLRITGIDFPQPGFKPAERVEETGRRLAEYAKKVGVPFEYHAVATTKWESVQPSTLFLRHDEVLIVSSLFRLKHLLDESVMVDSPRKLVLSRIRSMKPKVFIQSVMNANYNAPFFLSRFREAVAFYSTIFEAIDTAISPEYPERLLIEQSIMGREILNVVACEGLERVERAETYKQWQSRTLRAGFEQQPLRPEIYAKSRAMLSTYHKGFGIGQDGNWLLLGWKETVLHAMCTWRAR